MDGAEARFLPYGRQAIDEADIAAVAAVLRSPYLTTGPAVGGFEAALAARTGAPHAVACANATAALHLACLALRLGPGDAVVAPSLTFLATANAARMTGAEIVFADVDPASGLMRPGDFAAALARADAAGMRVRAVFPVHLAGQCAELPEIAALARSRGIAVVEDACHALGGAYRRADGAWAPIGSCADSDMTVFSFHAVKTVAAGEGGAVTTRDPGLARRVARLRNHAVAREADGFACPDMAFAPSGVANPWYYEMPELGWNYRLSDIHAALGTSQLGKLDRFVAERRGLAARYDMALAPAAPAIVPLDRLPGCRPAWHLYPVLIDFAGLGIARASLMAALREHGIGTQVHYIPVHRQPYYTERYGLADLPGADAYYARTLSLPLFVGLGEHDVDDVAAVLTRLVAEFSGAGR